MAIDIDRLREDLVDYYGTAMAAGNPMAMMDLIRAERAQPEDLLDMAVNNGFPLEHFEELI